jgi:proteic killer suppression protein
MIQNFKHKGLRLLWEQGDGSKLSADLVGRIERMLEVIDAAQKVPEDFAAFQNWNLHKLSGNFKDYWSIKVNKNYRIVSNFMDKHAYDVDYVGYH